MDTNYKVDKISLVCGSWVAHTDNLKEVWCGRD